MKKSLLSALILLASLSSPLTGCKKAGPAAGNDNYPMKTCVVSGEPLDSMGGPVTIQHEGRTVKFCCDGCIDDFKKDPQPYLEKLTLAAGK